MSSPLPSPLPPLLEDSLLADVLAGTPTGELAAKHRVRLSLLLDWLIAPTTRSRIAAALDAEDLAIHREHQVERRHAIRELAAQLKSTDTPPLERRRAASALLRPLHRRPFGLHGSTPLRGVPGLRSTPLRGVPCSSPAPGGGGVAALGDGGGGTHAPGVLPASPHRSILAPIPSPHTFSDPADTLKAVLFRLQHHDNPEPAAGLATLYTFSTEHRRNTTSPSELDYLAGRAHPARDGAPRPHQDTLLLGFTSVVLDPIHRADHAATQRATFAFADDSSLAATFRFTRHEDDYNRRSWLIDNIEHEVPDSTPDTS